MLARFGHRIAGLRRQQTIVYLSTIGVYGDRGGEWVDESARPERRLRLARQRGLQAEKPWAAHRQGKDKKVHILRLSGIYGPGRNALINLKARNGATLVKKDQVFNRIHVEDISPGHRRRLRHEGAGRGLQRQRRRALAAAGCRDFAAMLMGIEPPPEQDVATAEDMTPMTRSFYAENKRASNKKLKEELRIELAYPTYRVGLEALWQAGEGQ